MPTYEYHCPQGHDFEKFFSRISESTSELECPECGQIAERRISGGAGLLFKGSGFYLTDYGRNAHRKGAPDKKDTGGDGAKESTGDKKAGESGSGGGGMKAADAGAGGAGGKDKSSGGSGNSGGAGSSGGGGSTGSTKE